MTITKKLAAYYVYTLARPDGTVFYVGKGTTIQSRKEAIDRINIHEREALLPLAEAKKRKANLEKWKVIREIWASGGQVIKQKIYETSVEIDAYIYEWVLIYMIYGTDNLTNKLKYGVKYNYKSVDSVSTQSNEPIISDVNDLPKNESMIMANDKSKSEKMLSTTVAGKMLGVTSKTVIRMIESEQIPGYRVNFAWKIKQSDVEAYLESHRYKPDQQQDEQRNE